MIAPPDKLRNLQPEWSRCAIPSYFEGIDPPRVLQPANVLASSVTAVTSEAEVKKSAMPSQKLPSIVNPTNDPKLATHRHFSSTLGIDPGTVRSDPRPSLEGRLSDSWPAAQGKPLAASSGNADLHTTDRASNILVQQLASSKATQGIEATHTANLISHSRVVDLDPAKNSIDADVLTTESHPPNMLQTGLYSEDPASGLPVTSDLLVESTDPGDPRSTHLPSQQPWLDRSTNSHYYEYNDPISRNANSHFGQAGSQKIAQTPQAFPTIGFSDSVLTYQSIKPFISEDFTFKLPYTAEESYSTNSDPVSAQSPSPQASTLDSDSVRNAAPNGPHQDGHLSEKAASSTLQAPGTISRNATLTIGGTPVSAPRFMTMNHNITFNGRGTKTTQGMSFVRCILTVILELFFMLM